MRGRKSRQTDRQPGSNPPGWQWLGDMSQMLSRSPSGTCTARFRVNGRHARRDTVHRVVAACLCTRQIGWRMSGCAISGIRMNIHSFDILPPRLRYRDLLQAAKKGHRNGSQSNFLDSTWWYARQDYEKLLKPEALAGHQKWWNSISHLINWDHKHRVIEGIQYYWTLPVQIEGYPHGLYNCTKNGEYLFLMGIPPWVCISQRCV